MLSISVLLASLSRREIGYLSDIPRCRDRTCTSRTIVFDLCGHGVDLPELCSHGVWRGPVCYRGPRRPHHVDRQIPPEIRDHLCRQCSNLWLGGLIRAWNRLWGRVFYKFRETGQYEEGLQARAMKVQWDNYLNTKMTRLVDLAEGIEGGLEVYEDFELELFDTMDVMKRSYELDGAESGEVGRVEDYDSDGSGGGVELEYGFEGAGSRQI